MDINFTGAAYAYTTGEVNFNPVLGIEDGEVDLHTVAIRYIRTFELLGKSARFELAQAYQTGRWTGLLEGVPASADREGFADSTLRFAINLFGAPPLKGKEFAAYRAGVQCETIVGAGLVVQVPTGEYKKDKLINLGTNRFTFRPQIGVVHQRGKWSTEVTGSAWIFTDNDSFFGGKLVEQDPLLTIQGHLNYTFRPGLWLGGGIGYGFNGESTVDGAAVHDPKSNLIFGVRLGLPINRKVGVSIGYIGTRTDQDTGADLDSFTVGCSFLW